MRCSCASCPYPDGFFSLRYLALSLDILPEINWIILSRFMVVLSSRALVDSTSEVLKTQGRTPRKSYSRKSASLLSKCLLDSPFQPLLRTLLRTLPLIETRCKTPPKNPS